MVSFFIQNVLLIDILNIEFPCGGRGNYVNKQDSFTELANLAEIAQRPNVMRGHGELSNGCVVLFYSGFLSQGIVYIFLSFLFLTFL